MLELRDAVISNNLKEVKNLVKKNTIKNDELLLACGRMDIGHINIINNSFRFSSIANRYEIIKFLLESGFDVNKKDEKDENTALLIICKLFNELMYYIPDALDIGKMKIVEKDIIKIIKLLLYHGADPNLTDKFGNTPINRLLENDYEDFYYRKSLIKIIKMLIKAGADVNLKCFDELAIETFITKSESFSIAKEDSKIMKRIVKIMLKNGLNVNEIKEKYPALDLLFTYDLQRENRELKKEIGELKKKIGELNYRPGNPGYLEAEEDFAILTKKK